jgi:hypothetical protein
MALLSIDDLQAALNIDLTDPNGQAIATDLIAAAVAWVERTVGYHLEAESRTSYFDDGRCQLFLPTAAPVSDLTLASFNSITQAYDAVDPMTVRYSPDGEVHTTTWLPSGWQAVKASYTSGWTAETLPKDLRQALIDMVGIKLLEVANYSASTSSVDEEDVETTTTPTGALKRVQSDSYSEEYSTAQYDAIWKAKSTQLTHAIGDNLPQGIINTIHRYRRPFAI